MQKKALLILIILGISFSGNAQFTRYIIKLKDKGSSPYSLANPGQFLTQRALDRRNRYNIPIDSADIPVTPRYIDSIRLSGNVTILNNSRWLNQVAIKTSDAAALAKISGFPFVISASPIGSRIQPGSERPVNKIPDTATIAIDPSTMRPENISGYYNYGSSGGQVRLHNGDFLHNHGFRGEGMQMAVLDAGFYHYLDLATFDSIRMNNQVLGTWDFVTNNASVNEDNSHGMQCLSTIAANIPGTFVGTAPKTSFYLYRTEDVGSEYPIEEQNLAAGAERADSLGVDICSISLGYYDFDNAQFNYAYTDMNGNTSISARAADMAAKKGLLMVTAAGNEGNNSWHYLITPSDADSVLCVGAVDTTGLVGSFSSYGPSSDGQVKPAVAATGVYAVVANTSNGQPSYGFGTSFACPNMAGITTCLWQAFPEMNNMAIIDALETSANRFANPDNRTGYGIPDAKKAFVTLQKKTYSKLSSIANCTAQLQFSVKADNTMSISLERKLASETTYTEITTLQNSNAYGQHVFSYDDNLNGQPAGAIKYRVKMIIATDTSYYLDSLTIMHTEACNSFTANTISVDPNPVSSNLNVHIGLVADAGIKIVMHNALGQKVYSESFRQQAGLQVKKIPVSQLSNAVYFITVYVDDRKYFTKKIVRN